jgi:hypothetical protein
MPPPSRPLHLRLAQADVVAIGEVERVELGRIAVRGAQALRGEAGERFVIKRAPSRAPQLAAGDRALFLLQGAREPFVLVDEPRELLRLADPAREARWRDSLATLLAAGDDADAVLAAYLAWIDGDDDELRAAATRALSERRTPDAPPLPAAAALRRAAIALDPARPEAVRRASAGVACTAPEGLAALLVGVARDDVDPEVVKIALATGGLQRADGTSRATARALAHANPAVRGIGLGVAGWFAADPAVRAALERVARSDPDPALRAEAERTLGTPAAQLPAQSH